MKVAYKIFVMVYIQFNNLKFICLVIKRSKTLKELLWDRIFCLASLWSTASEASSSVSLANIEQDQNAHHLNFDFLFSFS